MKKYNLPGFQEANALPRRVLHDLYRLEKDACHVSKVSFFWRIFPSNVYGLENMKLKTLAISTSMAKSNCLPTSRGRRGGPSFRNCPQNMPKNLPVIPRHPIPKQQMTTEPKCYAVEVIEPSGNHYLKISLDSYGHVFLNEVEHTNNLKPPAKHTFFGIKKVGEANVPPSKPLRGRVHS